MIFINQTVYALSSPEIAVAMYGHVFVCFTFTDINFDFLTQKYEEEKGELETELNAKEDLLRALDEDKSIHSESMTKMEQTLAEKDEIIKWVISLAKNFIHLYTSLLSCEWMKKILDFDEMIFDTFVDLWVT